MIRANFVVLNKELTSEIGDGFTDKMCTLVTSQALGTSRLSNDVIKYKLGRCVYREILDWISFCPAGKIVYSSDDIPCLGMLG
jgi:hypothetical protein